MRDRPGQQLATVRDPPVVDPSTPVVTIERVDDDYFLSAETPVNVNGTPVAPGAAGQR